MVRAEDVISIYTLLSSSAIPFWLTGGWGIDALLGEQTRPHHDLDVFILLEHVQQVQGLLADQDYRLKEIWEENRWVMDSQDCRIATAFVLCDSQGREFDAHALQLDDQGNGLPALDVPEGIFFTRQDLSGVGTIGGYKVRCITPESQVFCHMGYQLPEKHLLDMELLSDKFGLALPEDFGK
jgi:lincosamide nucleotidyltransferase A/C/D/E